MNYTLVTPPAAEPLTLDEVKAHLRVDGTAEDGLISGLITAAREHVEQHTWRALVTQTWKGMRRGFRPEIRLAKGRLQSVDAVAYIDASGAEQTLPAATYTVDTAREPGRIVLAHNQSWPSVRDQINNVTITFTVGYGAAADVPQAIKQAMLLIIGHWYANREAVLVGDSAESLPLAVDALLAPYRLVSL